MSNTTDIIIIFDESGSMRCMGDEPVQSVNAFIQEQKREYIEGSRISVIMFNSTHRRVIDNILLQDVTYINEDDYKPIGSTALNDVICETINTELLRVKNKNKVLLIVTDGHENASIKYSTDNMRSAINNIRDNYDWKVVFIGDNLVYLDKDVINMGLDYESTIEFDQSINGDLLKLSRQASNSINTYKRARTEGDNNAKIILQKLNRHPTCPAKFNCQTDTSLINQIEQLPPLTRQYACM